MRRQRLAAALSTLALAAATLVTTGSATAADPAFVVRPSVNQLYVLGATPGQGLELLDGAGAVVASGTADSAGSLAWRELDAGTYAVRVAGDPATVSAPGTVSDVDGPAPAASLYSGQTLTAGFNYITTRDGTTLSANVVLPTG